MRNRLIGCCLALGAWAATTASADEPAELFQGGPHDALYGMCFDGPNGIAVGASGLVLESADAGDTWQPLAAFTDAALLDISCAGDTPVIVGQEGAVYRRVNSVFKRVDAGTDARLLGVAANRQGLAIAVGGFGAALRSTDAGESWSALSFDWHAILNDIVEPHLYAAHVSENGTATIVGEFGLVLRSIDGGDHWDVAHKGEASLFGIDLRDDGRGYAVGQDGAALTTRDGGATWTELAMPTDAILLDVGSSPGGDVFVSGIRAMLHSDNSGAGFRSIEAGDLHTGWYQPLVLPEQRARDENQAAGRVLLAGHAGRIISMYFEN